MVRLDTLKLEVPASSVKAVRWDQFVENQQTDMASGATDLIRKAKAASLPVGVSQILYKDGASFQITLSAKTLKDEYLESINLNNWDKAIAGLDPVMEIDANSLWDANPLVYRCDTTDNVPLSYLHTNQKGVCKALLAGKFNERFVSKWYESKRKLGVEFAGTQQEKNRLIAYSKDLDLQKRENKSFLKSLSNPYDVIEAAQHIIRIETNHTAFRSIRERFGIRENRLQQVLNAPNPVNHNFLKKVLNARSGQMSLFEEFLSMNIDPMQFIYIKGIEQIVSSFNCDELAIRQFFKDLLGERYKYFFYKSAMPIKQVIKKIKSQQPEELKSETSTICQRLLDQLIAA